MKLIEQPDAPINVPLEAVRTLNLLCQRLNFADYSSRIVHPLARLLGSQYAELRQEALKVRESFSSIYGIVVLVTFCASSDSNRRCVRLFDSSEPTTRISFRSWAR